MNWNNIKIRCSSIGAIMTEPVSKADKEAGNLSETAKAELIKVYNLEKYGRKTDIVTKYMEKGIEAEDDSLKLLGSIDIREYSKNEYTMENEFIKGTPDILWPSFDGMEIYEVKTCWNLDTFQANRYKKVNKDYFYQILGYMALTDSIRGEICYCLVNTPESILNGEKYRLLTRMDVATDEHPEYKKAAAELEFNHIFDDIPEIERVIRIKYDYNDEEMQKVYDKVKKCRIWLKEFDESSRII